MTPLDILLYPPDCSPNSRLRFERRQVPKLGYRQSGFERLVQEPFERERLLV